MSLHDLGRHRLADLAPAERIFELQEVDADAGPRPHSLDAVPNNLPVQMTGFVGRAQELAKVGERLATRHPHRDRRGREDPACHAGCG
jgi:hypothetical protein